MYQFSDVLSISFSILAFAVPVGALVIAGMGVGAFILGTILDLLMPLIDSVVDKVDEVRGR